MKKPVMNTTTDTGRAAITAALDTVQKRCTARTLTLADIDRILDRITRRLDITKSALKGTSIWYTGAQHFPSAYKRIPYSTHFQAEFNGRAWIITDIDRYICPNRTDDVTVSLSDAAKSAILAAHSTFRL